LFGYHEDLYDSVVTFVFIPTMRHMSRVSSPGAEHPSPTATVVEMSRTSGEKDLEVAGLDDQPDNIDHNDYPDGGLKAWLVVLGVRF